MNSIFFLRSFSSRLITQFVYIFLPYKRKYHGFKFYRAFSTLDYPRVSLCGFNKIIIMVSCDINTNNINVWIHLYSVKKLLKANNFQKESFGGGL